MSREPIDRLLARSSLGRPAARLLAQRTHSATATRVLQRAAALQARDFPASRGPTPQATTSTPGARRMGNAQIGANIMAGRRTSARAAKDASKTMRDGRTSKASKTAAASALSQRASGRRKGK